VPSSSMLIGHSACSSLLTTGAGLKCLMVRFDCTARVWRLPEQVGEVFLLRQDGLQPVEARFEIGHLRAELGQLLGDGHALADVDRSAARRLRCTSKRLIGRYRVQVVERRRAGHPQRDKQPLPGVPREFVQAQIQGVTVRIGDCSHLIGTRVGPPSRPADTTWAFHT